VRADGDEIFFSFGAFAHGLPLVWAGLEFFDGYVAHFKREGPERTQASSLLELPVVSSSSSAARLTIVTSVFPQSFLVCTAGASCVNVPQWLG